MTTRTRSFVIASLLVLSVGLGTGLVAYYVGLPAGPARPVGPDELKYLPRDAAVVAYANVREVMGSELRQRVRQALPARENGQREFQDQTGINIETDIDHVVASVDPRRQTGTVPASGIVLARGTFDEVKIEALMRARGAHVEDYKGKRLIVAEVGNRQRAAADTDDVSANRPVPAGTFALSFLEPGLAAIGSADLIRAAADLQQSGESVVANPDVMNLIRSVESSDAWAVGRFDALRSQAKLPDGVISRLPALTWFSVSGRVDSGLAGELRAETRDEESAKNLRDVVRGFMGLAKLQAGSKPELRPLVESLELRGAGTTVAVSFAVPAQVLDAFAAAQRPRTKRDDR